MFNYTSVVLVFIVHFRLSLLKLSTPANSGGQLKPCVLCVCVCVYFRPAASTNWTTVYNGSETEWIVSDDELNYHEAYVFRVAARNMIGWGPFSNDSLPFTYTPRQ